MRRTAARRALRAHAPAALALWAWLMSPFGSHAAECTVPGTHASIQAAIDSVGCDPIRLASRGYFESPEIPRSLTLSGNGSANTTIWGQVNAAGAGVLVLVQGLTVYSGCPGPALVASAGATVRSGDVVVARSAAAQCNAVVTLFADSFE